MDSKANLMRNKQILVQFQRVLRQYQKKYNDEPLTAKKLEEVTTNLIRVESGKINTEKGDE